MKKHHIAAFAIGLVFGVGLALSQMVNPGKVLAFLDVAGRWDPTLLFVMGGAVTFSLITFRLILRQSKPLLVARFELPTRKQLDRPLIVGALIFGIGWGLAGYCPGPAIASLGFGAWEPWLLVLSMAAGSLTYRWLSKYIVGSR